MSTDLISCLAIAHFLRDRQPINAQPAERIYALLIYLREFRRRYALLLENEKKLVLSEIGHALLCHLLNERPLLVPGDTHSQKAHFDEARKMTENRFDAGIVTIIGPELKAVLDQYGLNINRPTTHIEERPYWYAQLKSEFHSDLSLVISMVGQSRNVPCALAVLGMLDHFDVDIVCLTGIAAGAKDYLRIGDVVYAERILDYEHQRLTETGPENRPLIIEAEDSIKEEMQRLLVRQNLERLRGRVARFLTEGILRPKKYCPRIKKGTIAAGEKLVADGTLLEVGDDERIRALNQEDSGLVQACRHKKRDWAIFRGISDLGDGASKMPGQPKYHELASIAAASALSTYLADIWAGRKSTGA